MQYFKKNYMKGKFHKTI